MRKTQPQSETCERERCPHCHTLLHLDSRRCWACQKTPEEWAVERDDRRPRGEGAEMSQDTRDLIIGAVVGTIVLVAWILVVTLWEPFSAGALPGLLG